ncbi:MAG: HlyD family efflux transporter periplasmic adaptor subunit [Gammaproteobacteria bacterium]|nr:HlyD family efflux transporter periplasmic adaptor subunit [Gammaproteobacteria bacterium]NIR97104.1 HlyD family efflux transporter periplasmic adaptor subunit [Gammaproteobacteria bacterium]NIT62807.1 HlyD family efflux transporter periplasmic adaptor subunit [Gammaproteobacteria bacterium]NIV19772.1 HlyD family efflux transporter periplasmic adaptor subunit [Gammaproteobacteria bacterium]NIX11216.1 HlyD family efflux transporter periplasmic adaptor subunit [Gammaproteobacteria bacterium]
MGIGRVVLLATAAGAVGAATLWDWRAQQGGPPGAGLTLYGNVDIREVQLAFTVSERIVRMDVQEGERVSRGQPLAALDTRRLERAAERAQARVAAQRQVLARLEAGTRPEEIRRARAEAEAARVQAHDAERTFQRLRELAERSLAAREQADTAKAAFEAARARLEAAHQVLNLALAGLREEDIAAARATLRAYRADLALVRHDLAESRLNAPAGGVIRDRMLEPGDIASPQRPVYTLALTDPVWIRAYVPEPDLGRIRPGMPARVHTDSFPDKPYRGWIGYISPTAEFTPKSVETPQVRTDLVYQVRVHVCNPANELRLGMPATVTISLEAAPEAETGPHHPCPKAP